MYISLNWIDELVNIKDIKLEDLIDKLTLGGFEVEEVLKVNKENITLDISSTANRADSLSIKGISNEIKALLNKEIKSSQYLLNRNDNQQKIQETIKISSKSKDYSIFIAFTIENLNITTSPKWIKEKLIASQIEPSNNLLDFQTYLLLETGYPFEFYDLKKLQNLLNTNSFNLSLKQATNNLSFTALNQMSYKLNSKTLVLEANDFPISIAGITPNSEISFDDNSKSILVEAAIYNSQKIRQQSRILGLRTERSARYEKDLNESDLLQAIIRLVYLLKISNPNLICKIHTTSRIKKNRSLNIILRYETINEILGPIFDQSSSAFLQPYQISEYLKRLNFIFKFDTFKLIWYVEVPSSRIGDIEREIDVIEEIGRLHGFNKFATSLPSITRIGLEDASYKLRKKLITCFLNEGFNEVIQYSLVNDSNQNCIQLVNPLLRDCSTLRTTLLENLIELGSQNNNQSNSILNSFEFGHVFSGSLNTSYCEKEQVAGIFGALKVKREWDDTSKSLSWFEAKGKMEDLFSKLNIDIYWTKGIGKEYKDILHTYRSAQIKSTKSNISLGVFGQINPILAKHKSISSNLYLFEFDIDLLKDTIRKNSISLYKEYSLYPKITKDISFIVNKKITFDQIKTTLLTNTNQFLKNIELLDQYSGNSIPENHTSFCVQLIFQSNEKTLLNKDIEETIKHLIIILENTYQTIMRG